MESDTISGNTAHFNLFWQFSDLAQKQNINCQNQLQYHDPNSYDKKLAHFNETDIYPFQDQGSGMFHQYYFLMQEQKLNQQCWLSEQHENANPICNTVLKTNSNGISKSLQLLTMITDNDTNNDVYLDAVMEDFAANGHNTDEKLQEKMNNFEYTDHRYKGLTTTFDISTWNANNIGLQTQLQLDEKQHQIHQQQHHFQNKYQKTKTRKLYGPKRNKNMVKHCVFCENNKEPEAVVKSHSVRDDFGRVLCPKLRIYVCPICKASGDVAHTVKYCPKKPIITMETATLQEFIT